MYEFTDIKELSNMIFKVSLPEIKNANWKRYTGYHFIERVTICVYVEDLLIHENIIDASKRITHDMLLKQVSQIDASKRITNDMLLKQISQIDGSKTEFYIPLLIDTVEKEYAYLFNPLNKDLKYKVTCDIKLNKSPKSILLYDIIDKNQSVIIDEDYRIDILNTV